MGEVVHYRDPDTKLLACDGEDRRPEDLTTSMREHVTCTRCLAAGPLPDWREAVKAPAIAAGQVRKDESGVEWTVFSQVDVGWWLCCSPLGDGGIQRARFRDETIAAWPVVGDALRRECGPLLGANASLGKAGAYLEQFRGKSGIYSAAADARWLAERGEDAASLRALVEAVDAAYEKQHTSGTRPLDSRAKYVDSMAAELLMLQSIDDTCEACGDKEALTGRICGDCYPLDSDPDESASEDVPLGGLSREDAHFLISGVEGAASMLDHADAAAWPDARARIARYLRGLLK